MRLRNVPGSRETIADHPLCFLEEDPQAGKWHEIFKNDNPIYIEVGMGKGQFITTLAAMNPDINYIGIERYTSVLLRAVEKLENGAQEDVPTNILYICMDATELPDVFAAEEVAKIYLNFSDPWPKARHAKRRLTSREFLARYEKILKDDGLVEFKTDNKALFEFSLEEVGEAKWELLAHTFDLHHNEEMVRGNVMTEYEEKFSSQGNPICKLIMKQHRVE